MIAILLDLALKRDLRRSLGFHRYFYRGWIVVACTVAPALATAAEEVIESAAAPGPSIVQAVEIPPGSGVIESFIGCELPDGSGYWGAPTPEEMPWRVAIGMPKNSPQMGSRKQAREAAIESMRAWEQALQTKLPWFSLEFVEKDREAPVQITWKRRPTGDAQARAGPTCKMKGGRILAGGRMDFAIKACPTCKPLDLDEVGLIMAHEFAHILGLGHCLECDSATNYSWQTEKRIAVTQVDIDAVVRRFEVARETEGMTNSSPESADYVELAAGTPPVALEDANCKEPFRVKRSCSNKRGPTKRREIEGLEMLLGASKDGTIIFMTPDSVDELIGLGVATQATNDRFSVVTETAETEGVTALRATALNYGQQIVGYWIEFDGDAWSTLKR